ncbi:jg14003 [Pararge aegeria aegeria]|uniref:Jg14003 protein n=1 Tax=Pararge aegeria aegeria TaxID=348720 RepID=A0A8S4RC58_9NEOP|nr:jg14003 [Pararge aegeria aegeria]
MLEYQEILTPARSFKIGSYFARSLFGRVRTAVPSDYETERIENATVFAQALVNYDICRVLGKSRWRKVRETAYERM